MKRDRNFTGGEKTMFFELALTKEHIIESKKSDAHSLHLKNNAWLDIAESYNSLAETGNRTCKQLKELYQTMKRTAKRSGKGKNELLYTSSEHCTDDPLSNDCKEEDNSCDSSVEFCSEHENQVSEADTCSKTTVAPSIEETTMIVAPLCEANPVISTLNPAVNTSASRLMKLNEFKKRRQKFLTGNEHRKREALGESNKRKMESHELDMMHKRLLIEGQRLENEKLRLISAGIQLDNELKQMELLKMKAIN